MTEVRDPAEIDRDFSLPDVTMNPAEFNPYRETLRLVDRIVDLLDRVVDQAGVK